MDDDGTLFPITNWLDGDGEDCGPADAVVAVAGQGSCWFALSLSEFESVATQ